MKIGTCKAERGKITSGSLQVASDPSGGSVSVPVAIAQGNEDGKTLFLSAGVHGDEPNGIVIVQRFLQGLDPGALRGTLLVLPVVNVAGYRSQMREVPYDGKDLNRCFPGNASGTVSEQIAHRIFEEVVAGCDFGIDVHDSGSGSVLLPHPRAHIRNGSGGYDPARMEPIAVFGTDLIMLCRGMDGVMTIEAGRHLGVQAFTVEVGGAMILWEGFVRRAVTGLQNVLIHQGMMDGKVVLPNRQYVIPGEDDLAMKAPVGGILEVRTQLGKAVNRGDLLAEISDPVSGEKRAIVAAQCGVVHDLSIRARVNRGEDVVGVLAFTSCPERGRKPTSAHVETIFNESSDRVRLRTSEIFDEALELRI